MDDIDELERERRTLLALAYRMLGTVADAEDAVQETYVRWYRQSDAERERIENPRSPRRSDEPRLPPGSSPATRVAGYANAAQVPHLENSTTRSLVRSPRRRRPGSSRH